MKNLNIIKNLNFKFLYWFIIIIYFWGNLRKIMTFILCISRAFCCTSIRRRFFFFVFSSGTFFFGFSSISWRVLIFRRFSVLRFRRFGFRNFDFFWCYCWVSVFPFCFWCFSCRGFFFFLIFGFSFGCRFFAVFLYSFSVTFFRSF